MEYQYNQYEMDQEKDKMQGKAALALQKVLQAFFYILKVVLKVFWESIKGVLQTFGVPIK